MNVNVNLEEQPLKKQNTFRVVLSQEGNLFFEGYIDADQFNPFTRYNVDVRDLFKRSINRLQKVLSMREYDTVFDYGKVDQNDEESLYYIIDELYLKAAHSKWDTYNPQVIEYTIKIPNGDGSFEDRIIRGVKFRLSFFMNESPVIERDFYVENFNPTSRFSVELKEVFCTICENVSAKIKVDDVCNIWDDYDLITKKNMNIEQIRSLSFGERKRMLEMI